MNHQSGPSHFQTLCESALQDYEIQTGIPLADHPFAQQLQDCESVESITALLQEQAQAFSKFRESDKIFKSLKGVVSALSGVSAIPALGQAIGMVSPRQPIWLVFNVSDTYSIVIHTCGCNIYWPRYSTRCMYLFLPSTYVSCDTQVSQAFKGVTADLDALADLLESVDHFLKRLNIYTKVPPTTSMTEIVVKMMVELLSTLALATKQIRQGRPSEFA
jgi:hypothetical protein